MFGVYEMGLSFKVGDRAPYHLRQTCCALKYSTVTLWIKEKTDGLREGAEAVLYGLSLFKIYILI